MKGHFTIRSLGSYSIVFRTVQKILEKVEFTFVTESKGDFLTGYFIQLDKTCYFLLWLFRLWGDHGQEALEGAKICLINASATGTEILKNLILPGKICYLNYGDILTFSACDCHMHLGKQFTGFLLRNVVAGK